MNTEPNFSVHWPDIERFFQLQCRRNVFDFEAVSKALQRAILSGKFPRAAAHADADIFSPDVCRVHWALVVKSGAVLPAPAPRAAQRLSVAPLPGAIAANVRRHAAAARARGAEGLGAADEAIVQAALRSLAHGPARPGPEGVAPPTEAQPSSLVLLALRAQAFASGALPDSTTTAPGSPAPSDDEEDAEGADDGASGGHRRRRRRAAAAEFNITSNTSVEAAVEVASRSFPCASALAPGADAAPTLSLLSEISGVDDRGNECKVSSPGPSSPASPASPAAPASAPAVGPPALDLPASYVDEDFFIGFSAPRAGYEHTDPALRRRDEALRRFLGTPAPAPTAAASAAAVAAAPAAPAPAPAAAAAVDENADENEDLDVARARIVAQAHAQAATLAARMPFAAGDGTPAAAAAAAADSAGAARYLASSQAMAAAVAVLGLLDATNGRFRLSDIGGADVDAVPDVPEQQQQQQSERAAAVEEEDEDAEARLAAELDAQLEAEMEVMRRAEAALTAAAPV